MSKRLGNAADPFETLKEYGPDATLVHDIECNPWDLKFDLEELLRCAENSLELYTIPIRSLVCMLILMVLNTMK
jgi:isoleucyl-tRNA synthetase